MSTTFQFDCPHCRSKRSAFSTIGQYSHRSLKGTAFITAICGVCDFPILIQYTEIQVIRGFSFSNLTKGNFDFPSSNFIIDNSWPSAGGDTPIDLPVNVANFFEQGAQNERAENYDAAGAMFRKTLDVALKIIDPDLAKQNLFQRIEALVRDGKLTAAMGKWAHEIRIDGNESVHGDDPETAEDVDAIHQFCRAFLTYTFTLPSLVQSRRGE